MILISIKNSFEDDHITRTAGERLRAMLLKAAQKNAPVEIDFTGIVIASTSFFDEGFAKLFELGWTKEKFDSLIKLKNINKKDLKILNEMCRNRSGKAIP